MKFWEIEPEVSGHLGSGSILDSSSHPPIVSRLHFVFDGWMGDDLVTSFPCFLISARLAESLRKKNFTGYEIDEAEVSTSEEYVEMASIDPALPDLPVFLWLRVTGLVGRDDFGLSRTHDLVVSDGVIDSMRPFIRCADVSPFEGDSK